MFSNFLGFCGQRGVAAVNVTFQAIDPDDCPIEGAVYRLRCACGRFINAITGKNGCVTFCGVRPGTYELTQIAAPFGYEPDGDTHTVEVSPRCCVKIDGLPMRCFQSINQREPLPAPPQSPAPTVNPITASTLTITGTGEPCCRIELTFPDGMTCCTSVRRDGTWSGDIPCGGTLDPGDAVQAVQLCKCKLPSEPVTVVVPTAVPTA